MELSSTPQRDQHVVVWLCAAVVAACVVAASAVLAFGEAGGPWWLVPGALGLAAVVAHLVVSTRALRRQSEEYAEMERRYRTYLEVYGAFTSYLESMSKDELLPELPETPMCPEAAEEFDRIKAMVVRARESYLAQRSAVHASVVSLARKVQTSAHRMQEEAGRMVQRHPHDSDVLETSMRVDHAAAQQARYAQSLAALCGERPGQQWNEPLPLSDIVRGAAGRITAYQRVEAAGDPAIAVTARVAEPLIHVVAELLANAAQSSPPTTNVLVTMRSVQRGAVIEIDDCGVGMDDRRLEQARAVASGERIVDLFVLGEVPQTGLPAVGTYARRYGFRVDLGESVYGGVRAIVMVPSELTEPLPSGHASVSGQLTLTRQHDTADNLRPVPAPRPAERSTPSAVTTAAGAPWSGTAADGWPDPAAVSDLGDAPGRDPVSESGAERNSPDQGAPDQDTGQRSVFERSAGRSWVSERSDEQSTAVDQGSAADGDVGRTTVFEQGLMSGSGAAAADETAVFGNGLITDPGPPTQERGTASARPDTIPGATAEQPAEESHPEFVPGDGLPDLPRRKSRRGEVPVENSSEITMDLPAVPADPEQAAQQAGQWMSAFLSSDPAACRGTAVPPNSSLDAPDIPKE